MESTKRLVLAVCSAALLGGPPATGDVVTEWYSTAADIVVAAKIGPPNENRVLAVVQAAVLEAVDSIEGGLEGRGEEPRRRGAPLSRRPSPPRPGRSFPGSSRPGRRRSTPLARRLS